MSDVKPWYEAATPRPWRLTTATPYGTRVEVEGVTTAFCGAVAAMPGPSITPHEALQNARLIVSAVNAYEAHQRAAEALRAIVDDNEAACDCVPQFLAPCVWCSARAALAELDKVVKA